MEFWLILIALIIMLVSFPYLRCLCKRLACLWKVKRLCKKKGYALQPTHTLWYLGGKRGIKCDFYIETPRNVYAIKLFGMKRRLTTLILMENGEYCIKHIVGARHALFTWYTKPKVLPTYDFRYQFQEKWTAKKFHSILLIHPITMEVCLQEKNGMQKGMYYGDEVNGMEIHSLQHLLKVLDETQ